MKMFKTTVLLIFFFCGKNAHNIGSRLYYADPVAQNGENSSQEFPYIIEITFLDKHHCGGALIKEDLILTAAHCFPSYIGDDFSRYGLIAGNINAADLSDPQAQHRNIKTVKSHRGADSFSYDIALVKSDKPFDLTDYVQVINLPGRRDKTKHLSTVALGWGQRETGDLSKVLLKMNAQVQVNCSFCWSPDQQLCIKGAKKGVNQGVICGGDSGGPQVLHYANDPSQDVLIGIMHRGFDKVDKYNVICFGSYIVTKVAYFIKWINQQEKEINIENSPLKMAQNLSKKDTTPVKKPKRDCKCEINVRRNKLGDVAEICYKNSTL